MVDILSSAKDGANKTKIIYDAYLNFKQAGEYLDFFNGVRFAWKEYE